MPKKIKSKLSKRFLPKVTARPDIKAIDFPVQHYSASSMIDFTANPVMFKIKYVNGDRLDTTTNISAVIGKAFHKAMEVYFKGNPDMLPKDESEAIEFGLKTGLDFLDKYNDGFIEFSEKVQTKQKAQEIFAFAFANFVKEKPFNESDKILETEEEICGNIDVVWRGQRVNLPVKLKGYPDKIIRTADNKLIIEDYKTSASFSNPDKIDGAKIIQAVVYYLLAYAKYGEEPYSIRYRENKTTKNTKENEGKPQIQTNEFVYAKNELYFDFFFRLYQDITDALNGKMVYVPNVRALFDNEVALIAYIHRLDMDEEKAAAMKKLKVDNITDVLKKKIQNAGNMRKLLKTIEEKFAVAKNINYSAMTNEEKIETKLMEFGMIIKFDSKVEGASVDLYRYNPSIGLKMSRLEGFVADIEQVIGKSGIRVLAPIPGTSLIGFEVPREVRTFPALPRGANNGYELAIGQTIMGEARRFDIRSAPHLLVGGSSGSGKSVFLHSLIRQLKKAGADLVLIDPKRVEFSVYEGNQAAYTERGEISQIIRNLVEDMEFKYEKLLKLKKRDAIEAGWPPTFVIIDEYADLIMGEDRPKKSVKITETKKKDSFGDDTKVVLKETDGGEVSLAHNIQRLAQKGRAAGIHIILATQRASTKIISGDVKVNFPVKVVFRMSKDVDSKIMLDESGAEKLLGKGDCLFASDAGIERLQAYNI